MHELGRGAREVLLDQRDELAGGQARGDEIGVDLGQHAGAGGDQGVDEGRAHVAGSQRVGAEEDRAGHEGVGDGGLQALFQRLAAVLLVVEQVAAGGRQRLLAAVVALDHRA